MEKLSMRKIREALRQSFKLDLSARQIFTDQILIPQ